MAAGVLIYPPERPLPVIVTDGVVAPMRPREGKTLVMMGLTVTVAWADTGKERRPQSAEVQSKKHLLGTGVDSTLITALTEIVAVPRATPVTFPFASTVATEGSLLDQVPTLPLTVDCPVTPSQELSVSVIVKEDVAPIAMVSLLGLRAQVML